MSSPLHPGSVTVAAFHDAHFGRTYVLYREYAEARRHAKPRWTIRINGDFYCDFPTKAAALARIPANALPA